MLLSAVCDVASAVGTACAHASPAVDAPTVAQWSDQASHAYRELLSSYFANGPVAWLALVVVLFVLRRVAGFFALLLFADRKESE